MQPRNRRIDIGYCVAARLGRPPDQQHRDAQTSRRGDLAVGRRTSAVLRHHRLDGVPGEQRPLLGFAEGSALLDVSRMRDRQRRLNRIHAANEVVMLGSRGKGCDLLPAQGEKYAPGRDAQTLHGVLRIENLGPSISGNGGPGRPAKRNHRRLGLPGGADRMRRDRRRVGMSGVDQGVHRLVAQVACEAGDSAEAAAADGHGLRQGRDRAAGQRQGHGNIGARRQLLCELPRLRRTAKNQDMPSHVAR